jgi:hypothetical protein
VCSHSFLATAVTKLTSPDWDLVRFGVFVIKNRGFACGTSGDGLTMFPVRFSIDLAIATCRQIRRRRAMIFNIMRTTAGLSIFSRFFEHLSRRRHKTPIATPVKLWEVVVQYRAVILTCWYQETVQYSLRKKLSTLATFWGRYRSGPGFRTLQTPFGRC